MLGKLFSKNKPTENVGNKSAKLSKTDGMEKATYITIAGHPDKPSARIEKKITIGSEVGDLLVADQSISPRHCSIFINKGILSIMDHSSSMGTFINKKKLDPGKIFILSNKDKIRIGKFDVKMELLDVPSEATKVVVPSEMSEEHFEDKTATRTKLENTADLTAEVEEVKEQFAPPLPEFREMKLGEEEDFEEEYDESDDADDVDLTDIDVEEEELDMSILPAAVLERHQEANKKREIKLLKEAEKEKPVIDESGEDLVSDSYEVTAKGIKLKRSDAGDIEGVMVGEKKSNLKLASRPKLDQSRGRNGGRSVHKEKKVKIARDDSSFFLTRIFALLNDALICFVILEIFYVYTDFKVFYDSLPKDTWAFLKPHFDEYLLPLFNEHVLPHYQSLVKDYSVIEELVKDVVEYKNINDVLAFGFFLFFFRMVFGLIFSVSLGQLLMGIQVKGKFLIKRLVYPLRQLIGILGLPFFYILDLPALFSKRTFKEVITFSQYTTRSRTLALFAGIVVPIILTLLLCIAPMVKGFEILEPVQVTRDDKPLKKWNYEKPLYLKSLDLTYDQSATIAALPAFRLNVKGTKKILHVGVLFADLSTGGVVTVRKMKTFSLLDLYSSFVDLNYLAEQFQPEIYSLVRNVGRQNEDFKFKIESPEKLRDETLKLVESTYKLTLETLPDFILENGVFMRGFRDFREKMDHLFSGTIQELHLKQVGDHFGVLSTIGQGRDAVYEFIPVGRVDGVVYEFSDSMNSKKLVQIMQMLGWGELKQEGVIQQDNLTEFIDAYQQNKGNLSSPKVSQHIYETYYNVIKLMFENDHKQAITFLEKELQQFLNVLEQYPGMNESLVQKLSQLLQALKDQNMSYFNIQIKKTV